MRVGAALGLGIILVAGMSGTWTPAVHAQDTAAKPTVAQAVPTYRPPLRGAPASRIGGAHRGTEGADWTLLVLAPEHTGLTTAAQPALYWYTSKPVTQPVEITLIARGAIDPILERKVSGPVGVGVHRVPLADWGVFLEPDVEYQWFVSVIMDPTQRSKDVTAGATIRRVAADPHTQARLQGASSDTLAFVYAEEGLWYDAVDALSRRADAGPTAAAARQQRRALVEQVGLKLAAE
jgi:hypothetical protein